MSEDDVLAVLKQSLTVVRENKKKAMAINMWITNTRIRIFRENLDRSKRLTESYYEKRLTHAVC